uniref:Uncharacterized protein n=1 Tax=Chromera velia CCMP2878 TaxID=1169474 RepID=A0A0G4HBT9_9ALVE|eukprot:Cvel_26022.t1-p1 / transcript=Cvel_26022.t1 / gene=Cvel_26022 / organism=Chromera_velia_CCMP2878 / gene_product=hypothetical protein / transcript_product=hypothetical protein / location=Cvel_scaffold3030:8160-16761(-) / protein_length=1231 / sequence_SO=supercontig / SO=protein_coding / is_pseudo=false
MSGPVASLAANFLQAVSGVFEREEEKEGRETAVDETGREEIERPFSLLTGIFSPEDPRRRSLNEFLNKYWTGKSTGGHAGMRGEQIIDLISAVGDGRAPLPVIRAVGLSGFLKTSLVKEFVQGVLGAPCAFVDISAFALPLALPPSHPYGLGGGVSGLLSKSERARLVDEICRQLTESGGGRATTNKGRGRGRDGTQRGLSLTSRWSVKSLKRGDGDAKGAGERRRSGRLSAPPNDDSRSPPPTTPGKAKGSVGETPEAARPSLVEVSSSAAAPGTQRGRPGRPPKGREREASEWAAPPPPLSCSGAEGAERALGSLGEAVTRLQQVLKRVEAGGRTRRGLMVPSLGEKEGNRGDKEAGTENERKCAPFIILDNFHLLFQLWPEFLPALTRLREQCRPHGGTRVSLVLAGSPDVSCLGESRGLEGADGFELFVGGGGEAGRPDGPAPFDIFFDAFSQDETSSFLSKGEEGFSSLGLPSLLSRPSLPPLRRPCKKKEVEKEVGGREVSEKKEKEEFRERGRGKTEGEGKTSEKTSLQKTGEGLERARKKSTQRNDKPSQSASSSSSSSSSSSASASCVVKREKGVTESRRREPQESPHLRDMEAAAVKLGKTPSTANVRHSDRLLKNAAQQAADRNPEGTTRAPTETGPSPCPSSPVPMSDVSEEDEPERGMEEVKTGGRKSRTGCQEDDLMKDVEKHTAPVSLNPSGPGSPSKDLLGSFCRGASSSTTVRGYAEIARDTFRAALASRASGISSSSSSSSSAAAAAPAGRRGDREEDRDGDEREGAEGRSDVSQEELQFFHHQGALWGACVERVISCLHEQTAGNFHEICLAVRSVWPLFLKTVAVREERIPVDAFVEEGGGSEEKRLRKLEREEFLMNLKRKLDNALKEYQKTLLCHQAPRDRLMAVQQVCPERGGAKASLAASSRLSSQERSLVVSSSRGVGGGGGEEVMGLPRESRLLLVAAFLAGAGVQPQGHREKRERGQRKGQTQGRGRGRPSGVASQSQRGGLAAAGRASEQRPSKKARKESSAAAASASAGPSASLTLSGLLGVPEGGTGGDDEELRRRRKATRRGGETRRQKEGIAVWETKCRGGQRPFELSHLLRILKDLKESLEVSEWDWREGGEGREEGKGGERKGGRNLPPSRLTALSVLVRSGLLLVCGSGDRSEGGWGRASAVAGVGGRLRGGAGGASAGGSGLLEGKGRLYCRAPFDTVALVASSFKRRLEDLLAL